ncbi:MAG TPA: hypothetical protein VIB49_06940 [Thermoplasmata archaeon]|jgi:hypothetical protein
MTTGILAALAALSLVGMGTLGAMAVTFPSQPAGGSLLPCGMGNAPGMRGGGIMGDGNCACQDHASCHEHMYDHNNAWEHDGGHGMMP